MKYGTLSCRFSPALNSQGMQALCVVELLVRAAILKDVIIILLYLCSVIAEDVVFTWNVFKATEC
jgi:hypothetical protein